MRRIKKSPAPMLNFDPQRFGKIGVAVLVLLVLLDFAVPHHGYFALDGTFAFAAWFGALACLILILLALAVGSLLRSPEATYDD